MTEEDLEQKAEEYAKKKFETIGNFLITDDIAEIYKDGYKAGQKGKNYFNRFVEVSEENAELKAQIEKMRCCGNCEYGKGIMCSHDKRCMGNYEHWELINES